MIKSFSGILASFMKIVIAFDSFKGSLTASQACQITSDSLAHFIPGVKLCIKPMADGGEGTAQAMLQAPDGQWLPRTVTGPLPEMRIDAGFAWFEKDKTALIEMASASGIQLLRPEQYNPMKTTTYGTGELIKTALEYNPSRILLAVGGSATVDGGIGAAAALGFRFIGHDGKQVSLNGRGLGQIAKIIPPAEQKTLEVEVLCDVTNPLLGAEGAARIYGPQKGATEEMVEQLEQGLENLARIVSRDLKIEIANVPGAGASGGLSAGAICFMNAKLVSGAKTVIDFCNLEEELADADWLITGEGCFDHQSLYGKVVAAVAESANRYNTPVIVIAGQVLLPATEYKKACIRDAIACKPEDMSLDEAISKTPELLIAAVEKFARKYLI
jgi:glycerate kinase